jgi:predicted nucleic-acid-binding protein
VKTGIDTNVLVRFLTGDDPKQSQAAERLLKRKCSPAKPGWIGLIVLCELVWVLQRGYGYRREEISAVVSQLLATAELEIEDSDAVREALALYETGKADFSDGLLALCNARAGAEITYTFDRKAGRLPGFELVKG